MTQTSANSALAGPFEQGIALLAANRVDDAQRLATAFLGANPEQAAAHILLGMVKARRALSGGARSQRFFCSLRR